MNIDDADRTTGVTRFADSYVETRATSTAEPLIRRRRIESNLRTITITLVAGGTNIYSRERAKRAALSRYERRRSEWATASLENAASLSPKPMAPQVAGAERGFARRARSALPARQSFYQGDF